MKKAILISIKPRYVKDIIKGLKTLEIRKREPKFKLPIDVYIYCTKGNGIKDFITMYKHDLLTDEIGGCYINGKVVAKFTLKEIKDIYIIHFPNEYFYKATDLTKEQLEKQSCLSQIELDKYLQKHKGYAWCIDDLEIFGKPLDLQAHFDIDRPPQSWCYIYEQQD